MPSFSKPNATYAAVAAGAVAVTYAGTHAYKSRIQRAHDDGIDVKHQTVEVDPVEHIRRCTYYKDIDIFNFYKTIFPNIKTVGDVFYNGYMFSKNGPCVAYLDPEKKSEPLEWISYATALERIRLIGSHLWTNAELTPMKSTIAIMSLNRSEYSFVEHAGYMYGFAILGLYTNYDASTVLSVLDKTQTEVLVVDTLDRIDSFKNELLKRDYLKEILVMDKVTSDEDKKIRNIPEVLNSMQQSNVRPRPTIDPECIAALILTSGTTGWLKRKIISLINRNK